LNSGADAGDPYACYLYFQEGAARSDLGGYLERAAAGGWISAKNTLAKELQKIDLERSIELAAEVSGKLNSGVFFASH
jgi:hypothetical protein